MIGVGSTGIVSCRATGRAPFRGPRRPLRRPWAFEWLVWEFKTCYLASAEGDDAADGIVGGDPHGYSIARYDLDAKSAHPAAQLCEYLVPLVTLDAIQTATVHSHYGALHVDQIILAQALSFPNKDCATFVPPAQSQL